jgi:CheY-like chemotaxis protein
VIEGNYKREPEPGFVSGEEIRELLREDAGEPEDVSSSVAPASGRVLVVLRRGPDGDLISDRLKASGLDVTVLRNPFEALDQMRRDAYDAVVSDMALWANRGALLLERLGAPRRKIPVLFLASAEGQPREEVEAFALRHGAWRVLFMPLGAADLEKAVLDLRDACIKGAASTAAAEAPGREAPRFPPAQAVQASRASAPRAPGEPFGPAEAELAWLRFFYHSFSASREEGSFEARAGRILAAAMEHLRPRAAGVFFALDGRPHALLARSDAEPEEVLLHLLTAARSEGAPGILRLPLDFDPPGPRRQLVLFSPPPAVEAAAGRFLDAICALFSR